MDFFLSAVPDKLIQYDCLKCRAQCCHFLNHTSKLIISDSTQERIEKDHPEVSPFLNQQDGIHFLTTSKRCWFLKNSSCQLHQESGFESKPEQCKLYPFAIKQTLVGIPVLHYKPCPTVSISKERKGEPVKPLIQQISHLRKTYGDSRFEALFLEKGSLSHWRNSNPTAPQQLQSLLQKCIDFLNQDLSLEPLLDQLQIEISESLTAPLSDSEKMTVAALIPNILTEDFLTITDPKQWTILLKFFLESWIKAIPALRDSDGGYSLSWETARRKLEIKVLSEFLYLKIPSHVDFPRFQEGPELTEIMDQRTLQRFKLGNELAQIVPYLDGNQTIHTLCQEKGLVLLPRHENKLRLLVLQGLVDYSSSTPLSI